MYLQLPHHFLQRLLLELPQEVGLHEVSFFLSHQCGFNGNINALDVFHEWIPQKWGKIVTESIHILRIHELHKSTIFPRFCRLLQEKCPTSLLARLSGKQHFLIPLNVLDLVASQTVFWVGVYHCPLLPLIGIVTLVATFYIKKVVSNMSYRPFVTHEMFKVTSAFCEQ